MFGETLVESEPSLPSNSKNFCPRSKKQRKESDMTDLTENDLGKITAVPNVCLKQTSTPQVSQDKFRKIMLLVEAAKAM